MSIHIPSILDQSQPNAAHRPSLKMVLCIGNNAQGFLQRCSHCTLQKGTRPRGLLYSPAQTPLRASSPERGSRRKEAILVTDLPRQEAPFTIFPSENVGGHLFLICINVPYELVLAMALTHNSRRAEAPEAIHGPSRGITVPQAKLPPMKVGLVPTGPVMVSSLGLRTHFYTHGVHGGSRA